MKIIRIIFSAVFFLLNAAVILRMFGIALFIGTYDIFWIVYSFSLLVWIVLICKTKKKLLIVPLCIYGCIFCIAPFRIGGISDVHMTKIESPNAENTVMVKEFRRPIHSGFSIYKRCFLNIYYMTSLKDMQTGYYPFSEGKGEYEWLDEDTVTLKYPYSKDSDKFNEVTVKFN